MGDQVDPDAFTRDLGPLLPLPLHVVKTAAERGQGEARAARLGRVDEAHQALAARVPALETGRDPTA